MHWLNSHGVKVAIKRPDTERDAIRFLDDSLFFEQHTGQKLRPWAQPRSTTQPLQQVKQERSYAWLRSDLVPWLAPTLGVTRASLGPFQASIGEIFDNIKDHSNLDIGSIFVQHFPKKNTVEIAIADFGRGIPCNVKKVYPNLRDGDAIVKAVEPGFTTKGRPNNAGAGLNYLLTSAVVGNGGTVTIFSLAGAVRFSRGADDKITTTILPISGFCPGTTIDISLRTDTIPNLEEEPEDLEW